MDKRDAKASIPIKEYKKAGIKIQAAGKIQQVPFKPKPARLLDVLPVK